MFAKEMLEEAAQKIGAAIQETPLKDVSKNAKTAISSTMARFDLVTREEFEIQQQMIEHLCQEIATLLQEIEQLRQ